ncbi:MAG: acyl-[acyl-carrier-protein] thioesterase [Spirochaetia bacterium]|nr:acyl-[acyl-carrier-protein] thioesterase [Spirochaetia bacterium]
MLSNNVQATTRVSDLDTQRHVTSRTYESFCLEGRHALLTEHGFGIPKLLEDGITIRPTHCYVRFMQQQMAGATLNVKTHAYPKKDGSIAWEQRVEQMDGKVVCELELRTEISKNGKGISILPVTKKSFKPQYRELDPFTGTCTRIPNEYNSLYCERDIFGSYGPAQLWKVFEEGRWMFSAVAGLTLERFVEMDTTCFYMGGVFNFYEPIPAGKKLRVETWIESIEKIRFYFRQDVYSEDRLLMSLRDEQLIVSVKQARPRKAPPEFLAIIEKYVEKNG